MLFQIFARERKTGEYTDEPFYINSVVDDVDAAFEIADKQFGEYFQIKMILVLLAGCNAAIYHLKVEPLFSNLNLTDRLPLVIKITGFTSLTLWTGVLLLGRLIPYVGTG